MIFIIIYVKNVLRIYKEPPSTIGSKAEDSVRLLLFKNGIDPIVEVSLSKQQFIGVLYLKLPSDDSNFEAS
ncbi:hypothetical protein ASG65_01985 [Bacillus sp. Leaf13]|nr:hypothetical protein ASG65_01985 [Bacillus sp. Leaf13]KRF63341.1 hypothetical protein ASG99_04230 [Bacillus sp. Soil768D1]